MQRYASPKANVLMYYTSNLFKLDFSKVETEVTMDVEGFLKGVYEARFCTGLIR